MVHIETQELRDMKNIILKGYWMLKMPKNTTNKVPNGISLLFEMFSQLDHQLILVNLRLRGDLPIEILQLFDPPEFAYFTFKQEIVLCVFTFNITTLELHTLPLWIVPF